MAQYLHPDVFIVEVNSTPTIPGAGVTTVGMIAVTERGPDDRALLCTSLTQAQSIYGSYFKHNDSGTMKTAFAPFSLEGCFNNGATAVYVNRVTSATASASTVDLYQANTIPFDAASFANVANTITQNGSAFPAGLEFTNAGYVLDTTDKLAITSGTSVSAGTYAITNYAAGVFTLAASPDPGTADNSDTDGYILQKVLDVDSRYKGVWYNRVSLSTEKARTTLAGQYASLTGGTSTGAGVFVLTFGSGLTGITYKSAEKPRLIVTGGTNVTAGSYVITGISGNDITLSTSPSTGAGASVTAFLVSGAVPPSHANGFTSDVLTVASTLGFEAGDPILIEPTNYPNLTHGMTDSTSHIRIIRGIDSTNNILFLSRGIESKAAAGFASGTVRTCGTHRKTMVGFVDSSFTLGTTSTYADFKPSAANNVVIGQHFTLLGTATGVAYVNGDSAECNGVEADGIVSAIQQLADRDRIFFTSLSFRVSTGATSQLKGDDTAAVPVVAYSQEFDLNVYQDGILVESHPYLSCNATNTRDFIGNSTTDGRLRGTNNQSNLITAAMTDNSYGAGEFHKFPLTNGVVNLTGGSDGTFPSVTELTATAVLDRFNPASDMSILCCPDLVANGNSEATVKAGYKLLSDYGITHPLVFVIGDVPYNTVLKTASVLSPPQQVLSWRNGLPIDNNRTAPYFPWLVIADPTVPTSATANSTAFAQGYGVPTLYLPQSGHQAGVYAKVAAQNGPHWAPGNIPLVGVLDVTYNVTDAEHDLLNPRGINVTRFLQGSGIRTLGARTLWSTADGKHYINVVRLLQFVEASLKTAMRFAILRPNDPFLWNQVETVVEAFLTDIWRQGYLFPSNDKTQAFKVKCDSETNPREDRKAGRMTCYVGINPPYPAEFVIFRVGLFEGTTSITEVLGAAAGGIFV